MAYRKAEQSRLHKIYKVLPVYPEEYASTDIQKATGMDSHTICCLIRAMSTVAPICEENNKYCYPDERSREEFLRKERVV